MPQHSATSSPEGPTESHAALLTKVVEEPSDDLKVSFWPFAQIKIDWK